MADFSNYISDTIVSGTNDDDSITNSADKVIISASKGDDTVYSTGDNVSINGGAGNDTIYSGNSNVSINGGAGNDSLWGQGGADTFIYDNGDGKDVIFGFDDTDMLQINEEFTATYSSKNKTVAFKIGDTSNAIVLKSFTATTFNINGDTYAISNNKFVRK